MRAQVVALFAFVVCCSASPLDLWRLMLKPENLKNANDNIPALAESLGLTTLVEFVKEAGLAGALSGQGPFTLFGPNNEAFGKLNPEIVDRLKKNKTLLAEVLEYHVISGAVYSTDLKNDLLAPSLLSGRNIRINLYKNNTVATASGSRIIAVNQNASNGVIHTIDTVMLPPPGTVTYLVKTMDVFSTLLTAVSTAGLAGTLDSDGPFTVFAPTNEAFSKLPPGALDKLLKDPTALANVLKYHVVGATAYSAGLSDGDKVQTLNGQNVTISINQDGVQVNSANVVLPDVTVTNGVVHVIDSVLLPSSYFDNRMYYIKKGFSILRL